MSEAHKRAGKAARDVLQHVDSLIKGLDVLRTGLNRLDAVSRVAETPEDTLADRVEQVGHELNSVARDMVCVANSMKLAWSVETGAPIEWSAWIERP